MSSSERSAPDTPALGAAGSSAAALRVPDLQAPAITTGIPPYDLDFARVEYGRGIEYYCTRTRALGFVGKKRVLDAACGVAQWSLAFAPYNGEVVGVDFNANRLRVAQRVLRANPEVRNVCLVRADLHALPFPAASFDAVFCYGVLMFLDERRAVAEMARVLAPGGAVYICANGFGWSLCFTWERGVLRRDPLAVILGIKGVVDTLIEKRLLRRNPVTNTFLTQTEIAGILRDNAIEPVYSGGEGTYRANPAEAFAPVYRSKYLGFDCVLEWVGRKSDAPR